MTLPYSLRLLSVCLASLFVIHLFLTLVILTIVPFAIRSAGRMMPRSAAHVLLFLRLVPTGFALFLVATLCVPSYLWLEPRSVAETVGLPCLAAAFLGTAVFGTSIARALRACGNTRGFVRQLRGRKTHFFGEQVLVVEGAGPLIALAGIIHPQLVISREVVDTLSPDQLEAASRHERAHGVSRDNFKRLLILLAPGFYGLGRLDRAWAKFSEWAADDSAVAGDSRQSVLLAEALVRVSRLSSAAQPRFMVASFFATAQDFRERVERLLRATPPPGPARNMPIATALLLAAVLAAAALGPLSAVQQVLERLIH